MTARARYGLAAIVLVAAAAGGLILWRHGSAPALRTVKVDVFGARSVTSSQQPGIGYGGNSGHMIPPTNATTTEQQSPTDASVVLTTPPARPARPPRPSPGSARSPSSPGQQVSVSVHSTQATSLECTIALNGTQLAERSSTHPGTLTCTAHA